MAVSRQPKLTAVSANNGGEGSMRRSEWRAWFVIGVCNRGLAERYTRTHSIREAPCNHGLSRNGSLHARQQLPAQHHVTMQVVKEDPAAAPTAVPGEQRFPSRSTVNRKPPPGPAPPQLAITMPLHRRMTISQAKILFEKLDHVWNNTKAVGNRPFIPRSEFDSLLTEQSVSETICEITRDLEDGAITVPVDEIYRSYRKVLAILVMIRKEDWIAEFIDHGCSDGRLPLNATVLDKIDPEGGLSRSSFLEKQYLFLAQTIERNMEADWPESVVVPIIRQESLKAGRGGFATVSKIVIHSDYDNLLADGQPGDQKNKVIPLSPLPSSSTLPANTTAATDPVIPNQHVYACKILHQNPDPKALEESYRMEVEAGKRLRARNNANITPLLANFKHGNTYNLLFPFAECNLKDYFADEPPAVGHPDVQRLRFLEQIAKLASALSTIHNYVDSRVKGLEHYGYHRDLKPQNILKKGNTFMLADFGLTRFARPNEPNEQTGFEWDYGVSTYRAPECGHLGKKIGRRADIWSMACVFAEALTFSVKGSAGIKEFRERRTRKLDVESQASCVVDWFHDQYKVTKDVVDWLDHLGELNGGARSNLVTNFAKLVKEMMADVPKNRPNAKAVSLGLYNVLIREAWRLHVPLDLEKPITEDHEVFREKQNKLKRASSAIMFKRSSSAHEYASKLATMVDHYVCEPRPTKTRRRSAMDRVMVGM